MFIGCSDKITLSHKRSISQYFLDLDFRRGALHIHSKVRPDKPMLLWNDKFAINRHSCAARKADAVHQKICCEKSDIVTRQGCDFPEAESILKNNSSMRLRIIERTLCSADGISDPIAAFQFFGRRHWINHNHPIVCAKRLGKFFDNMSRRQINQK